VLEDLYPGGRAAGQAVVALPEHIGASNAGQVREELLSAINRGATTLIADMTMTISCDHAGADAVVRAWQRAAASGTELRLVVTAKTVSQVLGLRGLDRLVSVYPSLEAATAARLPATVTVLAAARPRRPAAFAAAVPDGTGTAPLAAELLEALQDAVALADGDGTIVAASGRMEEMFGYGCGELPGHLIESLVPDGLQEAHRGHWAAWARAPRTRPMAAGLRLAGLRKDGTTFPVRVSLTLVTAGFGQFTFVVIRDITGTGRLDDLVSLARDAAAAKQEHLQLLDTLITGLSHAGVSLQAGASLPADAAGRRTEAVLGELDDMIRQIRDAVFAGRAQPGPPPPRVSGGASQHPRKQHG
jgi:anti-anti-sigma factor